ncbi:MAG: hypothetical protein ACYS99_15030 [Planctomycetota bacterium]|jgi:hypothetical protein
MPDRTPAGTLRLGDEPAALARGRLLFDLAAEEGAEPELILPAKGEVRLRTTLDGEDAEWLARRARGRIPRHRDWLLALAAVAEAADPGALSGTLSARGLKEIAVLLASARRSAAHDVAYAFDALAGPPDRVRADRRLRAFREECHRAVGAALKARPRFSWRVALVSFVSAESVEDVVAARWRDQFSRYVVLAANSGYVAGGVTFAFRAGASLDVREILLASLPEGASPPEFTPDGRSGRGALPTDEFAALLAGLRFRRSATILPA